MKKTSLVCFLIFICVIQIKADKYGLKLPTIFSTEHTQKLDANITEYINMACFSHAEQEIKIFDDALEKIKEKIIEKILKDANIDDSEKAVRAMRKPMAQKSIAIAAKKAFLRRRYERIYMLDLEVISDLNYIANSNDKKAAILNFCTENGFHVNPNIPKEKEPYIIIYLTGDSKNNTRKLVLAVLTRKVFEDNNKELNVLVFTHENKQPNDIVVKNDKGDVKQIHYQADEKNLAILEKIMLNFVSIQK